MPKFYSELQEASLENLASDPAGTVAGRVWHNTTTTQVKTNDGTNARALLRNDQKIILGNNGTAANNVRLNRSANGVIQVVPGDDATAEGSDATSISQISARMENFTDAGKPAAGNAGRVVWLTDLLSAQVDNGTSYQSLGGGGGGGALRFIEAANAPVRVPSAIGLDYYDYEPGLSQALYLIIKVPTTYLAGRPVAMSGLWQNADSSGNVLITATATLVRAGTDSVADVTNNHTSTNGAVTMSGANQDKSQAISFDLSSATGTINSVAISAGDIIKVKIAENGSTNASGIWLMTDASEVTFS